MDVLDLLSAVLQGLLNSLVTPLVFVPAIGVGLLARQWWHVFLGAIVIFIVLTVISWLRLPAEASMVWPMLPLGILPPLAWAAATFRLRAWMQRRNREQPGNNAVRAVWLLLGLVAGGVVGCAIGIGIGVAYIELAKVSSFEGASGYVVFLLFAPAGLLIGAGGGAALGWWLSGRRLPSGAAV